MLVALGGGFLTAAQALILVARGDILCLNEGCKIVEQLTTVPSLVFNVAGSLYFFSVFLALLQGKRKEGGWLRVARLLLLAGVAAEGVLVGFQHYVAEAFCSYCLIVLALILLLNILSGWRQATAAAAVFCSVLIAFSALQFTPRSQTGDIALDEGSYARLTGQGADRDLYLFFSSTCPHCEEVIATIDTGITCNIRFNPIEQLPEPPMPGLSLSPAYSPEVNRRYLKNIGISEIPVLVAGQGGEIRVLKGKQLILEYLEKNCGDASTSIEMTSEVQDMAGAEKTTSPSFTSEAQEEDGACSVDQECAEIPSGESN